MSLSRGQRLERYTIKNSHEVLLVTISLNGEEDQIAIFRGFSSSLMRSTAFDPDVPVLPEGSEILSIDRLEAPYNPEHPCYIHKGLSWPEMDCYLEQNGL